MIKYALNCSKDHEFEGWFSSGEEFDRLQSTGHLECAVCGDRKVSKMLMAPSVQPARRKAVVPAPSNGTAAVPVAAGQVAEAVEAMPEEVRKAFVEQVRQFRKHVLANAENVGEKFSEEARRIHYGESPERGIFGQAKPEEIAELIEEEIPVMPLPVLPEDRD